MVVQNVKHTSNLRPASRELIEQTFDFLVASKKKAYLTNETWSEVLKIKAALLGEEAVPLENLITITNEDRLEASGRARRKRAIPCGELLLLFLARLCAAAIRGHVVSLKYDQTLELMLVSVFNDVVSHHISFLPVFEEVCGLPPSDEPSLGRSDCKRPSYRCAPENVSGCIVLPAEQPITDQNLRQTSNLRPVTRELIEQTFELLIASKPKVFLTEEAWSQVLQVKAALSAEVSVPLDGLDNLVAEGRLHGRRLDLQHPYTFGRPLLFFLARLSLVQACGHDVLLKHDQALELMLISVFIDAVEPDISFLTAYEEVCGLPVSEDIGPAMVRPRSSERRQAALH